MLVHNRTDEKLTKALREETQMHNFSQTRFTPSPHSLTSVSLKNYSTPSPQRLLSSVQLTNKTSLKIDHSSREPKNRDFERFHHHHLSIKQINCTLANHQQQNTDCSESSLFLPCELVSLTYDLFRHSPLNTQLEPYTNPKISSSLLPLSQ